MNTLRRGRKESKYSYGNDCAQECYSHRHSECPLRVDFSATCLQRHENEKDRLQHNLRQPEYHTSKADGAKWFECTKNLQNRSNEEVQATWDGEAL